jgi:hypothetical protein
MKVSRWAFIKANRLGGIADKHSRLEEQSLAAAAVRPVSELLRPGSAPRREPSITDPLIHLETDFPGPSQAELLRRAAFDAMPDANHDSRKSPEDWTGGTSKTKLDDTTYLRCEECFVVLRRRSNQVGRWAMGLKIMTKRSSSPTRRRGELAFFGYRRGYGLSVRAATAATAAGCRSLDELRGLGWHFFEHQKNCGTTTLEELSQLVGGWPDASRRHDALIRCVSDDALISELRRRRILVGHDESIWQC